MSLKNELKSIKNTLQGQFENMKEEYGCTIEELDTLRHENVDLKH
jgi:hypothetical protein